MQLAASDAQSGANGAAQAVRGLLNVMQNTLGLASDAAGLPSALGLRTSDDDPPNDGRLLVLDVQPTACS